MAHLHVVLAVVHLSCPSRLSCVFLFFFMAAATTEIYTLSLHDALPISSGPSARSPCADQTPSCRQARKSDPVLCWWRCSRDRKSTRLNSSHTVISYAVFCLKKKNERNGTRRM